MNNQNMQTNNPNMNIQVNMNPNMPNQQYMQNQQYQPPAMQGGFQG